MDNLIDKISKFVLYKKTHYRSLFTDHKRAFNLTKKTKSSNYICYLNRVH